MLDTLPEQAYDDIVEAASALMDVPIAAITFVDEDRQWFKAKVGTEVCETSRDIAACAHTILQVEPLVVPNATLDPRFRENPLVTSEFGLRFYAGAPIVVDGEAVGSLCCIDRVPREVSDRQVRALAALARQVNTLLVARLERARLEQTEQRFEAFFDNAPAALFLKDKEGRMQYVNHQLESIFGRSCEELLGLTDWDWLPEESAAGFEADDRRVRETGETLVVEERIPLEDGGHRIWRTLKFPVQMGSETWLGGFAFDITQLRDSEAKIQEQAEEIAQRNVELAKTLAMVESAGNAAQQAAHRFEQLFAGLPVACYTYDSEGRILELNAAAESLWGVPAFEAMMEPISSVIYPNGDEAEIQSEIERVFSGETIRGQERLVQMRNGTERWLLCSTIPLRNFAGDVVGAISANLDITERKATEDLLQEKEERFRTVLDSLQEGVMLYDVNDGVVLWNASATRLLGLEGDALRGQRPWDWKMVRPDGTEYAAERSPLLRALVTGKAQSPTRVGIRKSEEEFRWMNTSIAPLLTNKGKRPNAVVISFLDETERVEQEHKIGAQMEQIQRYSVELEMQKHELQRANSQLESLATTDGLTGLKNHRFFQEFLRRKVGQSQVVGMPLSLVLLDVDHFKTYNDEFGHQAGDAVLRTVAQVLTHGARGQDLVARYGGEEFVIVMPGTTSEAATATAERIRQALESQEFSCRGITASFGVASYGPLLNEAEALVRAADEALYLSKEMGRNRVTVWNSPSLVA